MKKGKDMGDKIKKGASRNELMVIICLCIYIFLLTFTNTAWYTFSEGTKVYTIFKLLRYVSYLLLFIVIMSDIIKHNYSRETLFYLICLLVFSFIGMFTGKDKALFFYIFLFGVAYGMSINKVVKSAFIIHAGILLVTVVCAFAGLADNSILDYERSRYSLGFNWPNLAPILLLFVALQYIYIRKNKITVWECIIIEVINILMYKFTNTKMSFFMLSALLAVVIICQLSATMKKLLKKALTSFKKLVVIIPAICAFIACWLPLYNPESTIWIKLNSVLSERLWQCRNAITRYGFTLLGRHIDFEVHNVLNGGVSDQTYFIDSGYLHIAMQSGLVIFVLLVFLYVICMYKAYANKDYYMLCIMIVISVFCINDIYFISPFNIFILYAFCDNDTFKEIPLLQKLSKPVGVVYDCIGNISSKMSKKER